MGPDGRIAAVGPAADLSGAGAATIDLGRAAIVPGLVDTHAHPELTVLRGRGRVDEPGFADWIERLIRYKYEILAPDWIRVSTWAGAAEAIAAGITCLAALDDAGHAMEALVETGLRGRVYREVFGPDPAGVDEAVEELSDRVEAMRALASDRVDVGIAPHAPYTVSFDLLRRLREYASTEGTPVTIHAAEAEAEVHFVRDGAGPFADRLRHRGLEVRGSGRSPVGWLAETGILELRPLLAHCVHVDAADIDTLADAGAAIAHCPIANARLGHGIAPLGAFLDRELTVGMGTDSVVTDDRVDLLEEARFARSLHAGVRRDPSAVDAGQLLRLCTLDGARALGLDDRIGSLEPGKDADFTVVRLSGPSTLPIGDPVEAVIGSARGSDVCMTVVGGRVLYRDGRFETLDWSALATELEEIERELDAAG